MKVTRSYKLQIYGNDSKLEDLRYSSTRYKKYLQHFVNQVSPAYTSITCSNCKTIDRKSRVNQSKFICSSCKSEFHADLNAARNIALKGQERVDNLLIQTPVKDKKVCLKSTLK